MPTVLPLYDDGDDLSPIAGAPILGGQLVEMSADKTVIPAGAVSLKVLGVASQDGVTGQIVRIKRDGVWPVVCATATVAGDQLAAAANGQVTQLGVSAQSALVAVCFKGAAAGGTCYAAMRIT